jgi:hypothetical protein
LVGFVSQSKAENVTFEIRGVVELDVDSEWVVRFDVVQDDRAGDSAGYVGTAG